MGMKFIVTCLCWSFCTFIIWTNFPQNVHNNGFHLTLIVLTECIDFVGKLNRGLSVIDSYKLLKEGELANDEVFLACALGWCIEWV